MTKLIRSRLSFLFFASATTLLGCGTPASDPEPATAEHSEALLGRTNFAGSDCTPALRSFLNKTMFYGRTAAASRAFAQCVDTAVRTGTSGIGPYLKCNGDPFYFDSIDTQ